MFVIFTVSCTANIYRYLVLGVIMVFAAAVDLATYTLPDHLTLGATLLGIVLPGGRLGKSLQGGLVGLSIMLVITYLSHGGMGGGDIKLTLAIGTFLGWPLVIPALVLAFLLGGTCGLILILTRAKCISDCIPFGPFLALGALISSLWGQELMQWYLVVIWGQI
jgi:leader peptidase (prepilin peptidase)/N-methyltransferase